MFIPLHNTAMLPDVPHLDIHSVCMICRYKEDHRNTLMQPWSSPLTNTLLDMLCNVLTAFLKKGTQRSLWPILNCTYAWAFISAHKTQPEVSYARIERSEDAVYSTNDHHDLLAHSHLDLSVPFPHPENMTLRQASWWWFSDKTLVLPSGVYWNLIHWKLD